jgi:hypothetical protein
VIIHYPPDLGTDDVAVLHRIAMRYPVDVVLAPCPSPRDPIALTAWRRIDILPALDQPRIERFIEAFRGRYDHGWARPNDCPATATGTQRPTT